MKNLLFYLLLFCLFNLNSIKLLSNPQPIQIDNNINNKEIIFNNKKIILFKKGVYQLKGNDIPIEGRIMIIADIYDALRSNRPYKEGFSHQKAFDILYVSDFF